MSNIDLIKLSVAARIRNNFLTGLIICAPIAITLWLTWTVVHWADSWVHPYIPARYDPENYLNFAVPGTGLVIAMIFITIIGFLGKNLIGQTIVQFGESVVRRVPLVRTIYKSVKQIVETVLNEQSTSFKKVGLIEYPSPGLWSVVFIRPTPRVRSLRSSTPWARTWSAFFCLRRRSRRLVSCFRTSRKDRHPRYERRGWSKAFDFGWSCDAGI